MKVNSELRFSLFREKGKWVFRTDEVFEKATDGYTKYNNLMQERAKLASNMTQYSQVLDESHKGLNILDQMTGIFGIHIPEIRNDVKKMAEKFKEEVVKEHDENKNKIRDDVNKGVKSEQLFKKEDKEDTLQDSETDAGG